MDITPLKNLVNIDSPSGFTQKAEEFIVETLKDIGFNAERNNKGAVTCNLGPDPELVIAAHTDTLGGIVTAIKPDGTLEISNIGGLLLNAYEGCYVRIYSSLGKVYTGTFLLDNPAIHVNKDIRSTKRELMNMHIRIDEETWSKTDTEKLGIQPGDFVCFEPHFEETESGFIKSKFMDNKASCFVLFEIAKWAKAQGKDYPVQLFFSNYEEVGHGASSGFAGTVVDMLCLDMAVVGNGCAGREDKVSICAKDSSGPYDHGFRKELEELCKKNDIPYVIDIYPYYGSDGSAALRAGYNYRVGLIGMGVSASHGIERTHKKGVKATVDLCLAYIGQRFANG